MSETPTESEMELLTSENNVEGNAITREALRGETSANVISDDSSPMSAWKIKDLFGLKFDKK